MFRVGAHVSIAGGFSKAIDRELEEGGNCGQIFCNSNRSLRFTPLNEEEVVLFREKLKKSDIDPVLVHCSYLINVCSTNESLRKASLEAIKKEIQIIEKLGLKYLVLHPGSHLKTGEEKGLA